MWHCFKKAVAAGIAIAMGGMAFIACESKILGAFLFTLGLYTVCAFDLNLFTGKIGYLLKNRNYKECLVIWFGNLVGAVASGLLFRIARPDLIEKAQTVVNNKLSLGFWQILGLSFFCGVLIYIAVHGYRIKEHLGKYLGILLCVPAFILCGFEHCVADMFYFTVGVHTVEDGLLACLFVAIATIGNGLGSLAFRGISRHMDEKMR